MVVRVVRVHRDKHRRIAVFAVFDAAGLVCARSINKLVIHDQSSALNASLPAVLPVHKRPVFPIENPVPLFLLPKI